MFCFVFLARGGNVETQKAGYNSGALGLDDGIMGRFLCCGCLVGCSVKLLVGYWLVAITRCISFPFHA